MSSIPPSGPGRWRNPFDGHRFVAVTSRAHGVYEVTVAAGALLRDLVDATATLPRAIYTDHRPVAPGHTDVLLTFRTLGDRLPASGGGDGWVPPDGTWAMPAWNSFQEALHVLLTRIPGGPTGERLSSEILGLDPRSVVALADMVRDHRPVRT